jgi:Ca2+/Na+ antiporter
LLGSSAPELFTSLVGISVDSDVGVGTIFGSAVFNILVIVALRLVLLACSRLQPIANFDVALLLRVKFFTWTGRC